METIDFTERGHALCPLCGTLIDLEAIDETVEYYGCPDCGFTMYSELPQPTEINQEINQ